MASLYHPQEYPVNSRPVTGSYLAHNGCDRVERAFLASDIYSSKKHLINPTMVQSAQLARTNVTYAWWAHRRQSERWEILSRRIPFGPPKAVVPQTTNGAGSSATLAPEVDAGLMRLVREIGVDKILDAAVAVESAVQ